MKKILLSSALVLVFVFYAIHQRLEDQSALSKVNLPTETLSDSQSMPTGQPAVNQPTNSYKNGQYTGDVTDAYYGNIQVKAVISAGKISDVQFLQFPNDRSTSIMINQQAMPLLKQEAIQAQSASVDIISGATQTSQAFRISLQSALDQAK